VLTLARAGRRRGQILRLALKLDFVLASLNTLKNAAGLLGGAALVVRLPVLFGIGFSGGLLVDLVLDVHFLVGDGTIVILLGALVGGAEEIILIGLVNC
jgi:hypothetical protein